MLEVLGYILSVCLLSLVDGSSYGTCTPLTNLPFLRQGEYMVNQTDYLILDNLHPIECVKECMKSSPCKAINFILSVGKCILYDYVPGDHGDSSRFLRTKIHDWPRYLAGACSYHSCPNNTICTEIDSESYECKVIGCLSNPNQSKDIKPRKPFWEIGYKINVSCPVGFYSRTSSVCQKSGHWSDFECLPYPRNCSEVKNCNSSYGDGEYWLFYSDGVENKRIKIYCDQMSTDQPKEYVTLFHENFSWKLKYEYLQSLGCDSRLVERNEANFTKVGLNVTILEILKNDKRFSSFTSGMWYGEGGDCLEKREGCPTLGKFTVNLQNTSFIVSNTTRWDPPSHGYIYSITRSSNNQIVKGLCGGRDGNLCAMCGVFSTEFLIEINPDYQPDFNSAVLPVCGV